ncbi:MAG: hypothetical protein ACYTG3_16865 [Planctomycetota bacterium]|jgi:hypothetical protein
MRRRAVLSVFAATSLAAALALVLARPVTAGPTPVNAVVNGSFETGDYTGWTLLEVGLGIPSWGTWGIAADGQTVVPGGSVFDHFDQIFVTQTSPGLPITYLATDGDYVALQLQNGPERHRMYQDVTIWAGAFLTWDMRYTNHDIGFNPSQFLAVHIRNPVDDSILETLFVTAPGDAPAIGMTSFTADLSAYAGQTVRLDVEMNVQLFYFDATFDNFSITSNVPPGWRKGKKVGWKAVGRPGMGKAKPVPPGFDDGKKKGWAK